MIRLRNLLLFVAATACTAVMAQGNIVAQEYWIDGDIGARQPLGASVAQVDIAALAPGAHTLTMRVKNDAGRWSPAVTRYFFIAETVPQATAIVAQEYWIDGDIVARQPLGASVAQVDIASLAPGAHTLTMRVKNDAGRWSPAVTRYFLKPTKEEEETATIVRCMYWFDNDVDHFLTAGVDGETGMVPVDVSELAAGAHTIFWRVGDSKGAWSDKVESDKFFRYTVPASGLGTFSADVALALPEGLDAYTTTTQLNTHTDGRLFVKVRRLRDGAIPAETGVVLHGEGGAKLTLVQTDEEVSVGDDNTLVAVVEPIHVAPTEGDFTNFMLKSGTFIRIAEAEASSMMPANRAYLQLPTEALTSEAGVNGISIQWEDDETTGIAEMRGETPQDDACYDLQGRRVTSPQRGVYITNGKKVVVK